MKTGLIRRDGAHFQQQDARDDLQAVGNAVLDLEHQCLLLLQQQVLQTVCFMARRHVLQRHQQRGVGLLLLQHQTCVEQHAASSGVRQIDFDLIALNNHIVPNDVFEKLAQPGQTQLAATQFMEQTTLRCFSFQLEQAIERTARRHDAQVTIKHDERFPDGRHNGVRQSIATVQFKAAGRARRPVWCQFLPVFRRFGSSRRFLTDCQICLRSIRSWPELWAWLPARVLDASENPASNKMLCRGGTGGLYRIDHSESFTRGSVAFSLICSDISVLLAKMVMQEKIVDRCCFVQA